MPHYQAKVKCETCGYILKIQNHKAAEIIYDMYHYKQFKCNKCEAINCASDSLFFDRLDQGDKE